MKKILLVLSLLACALAARLPAQTPNRFNYQAVAKKADGAPVTGSMFVRFTILDGSVTGPELYKELFNNATADANGLFTLQIGSGQPLGNTQWANINWASDAKFLKVEIKPVGAADYIVMGDPQQLLSVPYAQEAKGLDLPFGRTVNTGGGSALYINNGYGNGLYGVSSTEGDGVVGEYSGSNTWAGVAGHCYSPNGNAVWGGNYAHNWGGLLGGKDFAGYFWNGTVRIDGGGLEANRINAPAVRGDAENFDAVLGVSTGDHTWAGVAGHCYSPNGSGVWGGNITNGRYGILGGKDYAGYFSGGAVRVDGSAVSEPITFAYYAKSEVAFPPLVTTLTGGAGFPGAGVPVNYSIYGSDRILGAEFNAFSDARIKKIIGQSDAVSDLATLLRLQVTDYTHKDVAAKGTAAKKGFIAQEVEQVFPEAVSRGKDFIPDVYAPAEEVVSDYKLRTLTMTLDRPANLKPGDRVRLIADKQYEVDVSEVSGNSFTVKDWPEQDTKQVFVFGKEVDDFRTVDYDRIFTLNVSATQQLAREVAALKAENEAFRQQFLQMQAQLASLTAQRDAPVNPIGSTHK